jgi:protein-tyrosine kinase
MERLRDAIAKARAMRQGEFAEPDRQAARRPPRPGQGPGQGPAMSPGPSSPDVWETIERVQIDDARIADERIVAWKKTDPAHIAFDVLRTRLLRILAENGWRKVLITSPSKGCGKTTVSINLAVSLSRQAAVRTLLFDLDLRTPGIARRLGFSAASVADWLRADPPPRPPFVRIGDNLAVCLNRPVQNSAELLQDERTAQRLDAAIAELDPAAVIYDTPPMLACDDALGLLPQVDCVLLVAGAGQTTAEEIEECERLLEGHTNFLGVLLNKCEPLPGAGYPYYESYGAP